MRFEVRGELAGERVDLAARRLSGGRLTRAEARRLIEGGSILLGGRRVKPSARVAAGDVIDVTLPPDAPAAGIEPQEIDFGIAYEDGDLVVVDKPPGLVVHPGAGRSDRTLVNALVHRFAEIEGGDPSRPGIVHRLDKDTSGLMLVARNRRAHAALSEMIKAKAVTREYAALVWGRPPARGVIDTPYGRSRRDRKKFTSRGAGDGPRRAVTRYWRERAFEKAGVSLVRCVLETGRTHQIRVHLSESGWPVVGDPQYGRGSAPAGGAAAARGARRTMLHARRLAFAHPTTGEPMELRAEPPEDFRAVVAALERFEREEP